jgi:hypothetical protein
MISLDKLNELLNRLTIDLRVEFVLADLLMQGFNLEDVSIFSNSVFRRNYHRDIEKVELLKDNRGRNKLWLTVNRDGIYDKLPEDLFHQPGELGPNSGKEKIIQEIKVQDGLENASRSFFLPFEQEFYNLLVNLELKEREFLFESNNPEPGDFFDSLWDFPEFLDEQQKNKLGVLMPALHKIVGNPELMAQLISLISANDVEVFNSEPNTMKMDVYPVLGETHLGKDSILGGELRDLRPSLTVRIFVDDLTRLEEYLPDGIRIKIHDYLVKLFAPYDTPISLVPDFSRTSSSFLIENNESYLGRLNYTTFI